MKKKTFGANTIWPASAELNIISYTIARHNKTHSVQKKVYNVITILFFSNSLQKYNGKSNAYLSKRIIFYPALHSAQNPQKIP